jgi:hypothetical protein
LPWKLVLLGKLDLKNLGLYLNAIYDLISTPHLPWGVGFYLTELDFAL